MIPDLVWDFDELVYEFPKDENANQLGPGRNSKFRSFDLPIPEFGCLDETSEDYIHECSVDDYVISKLQLLQLISIAEHVPESELADIVVMVGEACEKHGYFPGNSYQIARRRILLEAKDKKYIESVKHYHITMGYSRRISPVTITQNNEVVFEAATKPILKVFAHGMIQLLKAKNEADFCTRYKVALSGVQAVFQYIKSSSVEDLPVARFENEIDVQLVQELVGIQLEFLMAHEFAHIFYGHTKQFCLFAEEQRLGNAVSAEEYHVMEYEADMHAVDTLLSFDDKIYSKYLGDAIGLLFAFLKLYSCLLPVDKALHPSADERYKRLRSMFSLEQSSSNIADIAFRFANES